jgi:hypothetical protein
MHDTGVLLVLLLRCCICCLMCMRSVQGPGLTDVELLQMISSLGALRFAPSPRVRTVVLTSRGALGSVAATP